MKLANIEFENPYFLNKKINYFIVENKSKFYEYCTLITAQCNGECGNFVLSEKGKELSFKNQVITIDNLLNINLSERRITQKLHQTTSSMIYNDFVEEFNKLSISIVEFMQIISLENDFETEYNDAFDVSAILKAIEYKLINNAESLLETIVDYITVIIRFFNPKLIVFFNLRSWLSDDDCLQLYNFINYNDIKVLLLESKSYKKLENENYFVIDNDLCELTY